MAKLSREATTFRRVLESLFRHFDNNNSWSSLNTLALSVLLDMQMLMENSGQNMNLMISILVKHLEHKSVSKQPEVQLSIVEVIASLAEQSRAQASAATIGAISDLVRHMKKTLQVAVGSRELELVKWNDKLRKAVDDCIVQLSKKVGDAGPVLDMMSVMLENISRTPLIAIATTSAVYRTAQIIASIPNLSYKNKVFPEVLFHQLLLAMVHPDHETRVSAHRIFSVVLVPSSVSPFPHSETPDQLRKQEIQRTLSRAVSVFSSSAALFDKLRRDKTSFRENTQDGSRNKTLYGIGDETASPKNLSGSQSRIRSFRVPNLSIKRVPSSSLRSSVSLKESQNSSTESCNEMERAFLRLSSHQATLLLSSIWAQAISHKNSPQNYEAIAHTYSLLLLFSGSKIAIFEALAPSFQVAFSLMARSLQETDSLSPSRRRSLFTLATSMIIFSSRAFNVAPLIPICKSLLNERTVDPFLHLVHETKLQAVKDYSEDPSNTYGSAEDDANALKFLSAVNLTGSHSRQFMTSMIMNSITDLPDMELESIRSQLLNDFCPDEMCPINAQFFEAPSKNPLSVSEDDFFHQEAPLVDMGNETLAEVYETMPTSTGMPVPTTDLLGIDELLETVGTGTSSQAARYSVSTAPDMPFKDMTSQCEALSMGKQQKMSAFMSFKHSWQASIPENDPINHAEPAHIFDEQKNTNPFLQENYPTDGGAQTGGNLQHQHLLKLPASSPYDNFLKAAGC
ncbi:hypothetical protein QYE76_020279 [Lolium multiflorum]|nr:hypothetical protein QYE76_020279 [Lolium multiflorum]